MDLQPYEVFETRFAEWANTENVVGCSSGTAALHLALEAMDFKPGSHVLIPDFTMIAVARAVRLAGLEPILVDCDHTLNMDTGLIIQALQYGTIDPNTLSAMILVHTYGRQAKINENLLNGLNIKVIEDRAEYHIPTQGSWKHSDAYCWSFYRNKIIHGEEGGAVAFKSKKHAAKAKSLRSLGFTEDHDYTHIPRGHNYRLSNAHATLILHSLSNWSIERDERYKLEDTYNQICPRPWRRALRDSVWVYDIRIPFIGGHVQDRIIKMLNLAGIPARHGFKPVHQQREFMNCQLLREHNLATQYSREIIYLPCRPGIDTEESIKESFRIIQDVVGKPEPS